MDRKAQSALEYLMTYGWALIVIAIVIGVLILVTSGATGGVTCQSSSSGIVVNQSAVSVANGIQLSLQNSTGYDITITDVTVDGGTSTSTLVDTAAKAGATDMPGSEAVTKNTAVAITGITATAGNLSSAKVNVTYTSNGLTGTAAIVCNGTVQ